MLSHKYGKCYLPTVIPEREFKLIEEEIKNLSNIDNSYNARKLKINDLLNYFYKFDKNESPFCYKLIDKDLVIPGFDVEVKLC